jgi:hypothetical protein
LIVGLPRDSFWIMETVASYERKKKSGLTKISGNYFQTKFVAPGNPFRGRKNFEHLGFVKFFFRKFWHSFLRCIVCWEPGNKNKEVGPPSIIRSRKEEIEGFVPTKGITSMGATLHTGSGIVGSIFVGNASSCFHSARRDEGWLLVGKPLSRVVQDEILGTYIFCYH